MNERTVRRFKIYGTVVLTCLLLLVAAAPALAAPAVSSKTAPWQLSSGDKLPALEFGPDAALFTRAHPTPRPEPFTESVQAVCFQTALAQDNSTSGNARAPNLRFRFERAHYLIKASELAGANVLNGTVFSGMGFNFNTAPGLSGSINLNVYMENTADTTNVKSGTWATAIGTMSPVHTGAITVPDVTGTWDFNFAGAPAFTYTGGGLYIAFDAEYPVGALSTTTVVFCNSTGLPAGLKGAQSNVAAPAAVTASNFRPHTRLAGAATTILNDAEVTLIQSYGVIPRDLAGPQTVRALITNQGANAISNLQVSLSITGANTFSNTVNIPGPIPPCGGSTFANFAPFTATNLGSNFLTVMVLPDDVNTNNSATVPMDVTLPEYSFKLPGTLADGGVGATVPIIVVGKFPVTAPTAVTDVKLEFFAASATTYRVALYQDDGLGKPGLQLYADAADRTVAAPGPVTITLPSPIAVVAGNFYAGIQQTNAVNASLGFDQESPIRVGKFYITDFPVSIWDDFAPGTDFKLNIGVVLDPCAAGAAACNDADDCTDDTCVAGVGCTHAPTAACNDFDACTLDTCVTDFGCFNDPIDCNDNNACTDDTCIPQALVSNACTVADNGSGTVSLPPAGCTYLSPQDVHQITAGLPPGTTILLNGAHREFICHQPGGPAGCSFVPNPACEQPGGGLGGQDECADSLLQLQLKGTGTLAGWNRTVNVPISFETNTAPRTPGQSVQSFATEMVRAQGQITGDPDFDLLRITGGSAFNMPSPGHTTLVQATPGGPWKVDSFFDITYRIDFIGAPGGPIAGRSGSTTATIRMSTGDGTGCVSTPTNCDDANPCTIDACDSITGCSHAAINCDDGQACTDDTCNTTNGQCVHSPTNCDDNNACTVDTCVQALLTPQCTVPDNGGGTVTLPPVGCDYLSPSDVHEITAGLPAGTTIEFGASHKGFICGDQAGLPTVCSFVPPPAICDVPGGDLGGRKECAQSTLDMNLAGTGGLAGWNRTVNIPISFETHVGPRTPGAPTQSFPTEMFRLFGQILGDPDFDLLRFVAGNDFGLPSPGHTTLTQLPGGQWKVDSFFDITYRIDFVGAPGGHVAGRSGSTTGTIRMQVGAGIGCVHTPGPAPTEVTGVTANKSGSAIVVNWPASATTYDVVRGSLAALPVGPGGGDEVCLSNDVAGTTLNDPATAPVGNGAWYLVRGNNACGAGPYGTQGLNGTPSTPRATTTCP